MIPPPSAPIDQDITVTDAAVDAAGFPRAFNARDSVEMGDTTEWTADNRPLLPDDVDGEEDGEAEARSFAQRSALGSNTEQQPFPDKSPVRSVQLNGNRGYPAPEVKTESCAIANENPQEENSGGGGDGAGIKPTCRAYVTVIVLFCVNLLNYSDRYTIAANLSDIQKYFYIGDNNSSAGLLQTVFIVGYMLTSPIFGYLGDRYSRKYIVSGGILTWSALTLAGSFVPRDMYWLFLLIRAAVGIGEASYVTIAATLIGDLFVGNGRTRMLMLFYFAIPVGSGLGYILGKVVAEAFSDWRWALRITPPLGIVCVVLILGLVKEPKRGQAETGNHTMVNTSYTADIMALVRNKSYISSTLGLTSVCWVTGALALWAVTAVEDAYKLQGLSPGSVSIIFGVVTMAAGFLGVGMGTTIAQILRKRCRSADPLVCSAGMLLSAPFLFIALELSDMSVSVTWTFVFIAETLVCLNWALVPDILLAVLIPTRRSTGNAIQMLISHLLGDALSPYLVGAVSDKIRKSHIDSESYEAQYQSLIYALYMTCFVTVLGGGAFLWCALHFENDKKRVEKIIETMAKQSDTSPCNT